MKYDVYGEAMRQYGRTPHGVRGLKFLCYFVMVCSTGVAPLTGCVD